MAPLKDVWRLRRSVKEALMFSPLDAAVTLAARGLDYAEPIFSPAPATETVALLDGRYRLTLPPQLPSANRLIAGSFEPEVSGIVKQLLAPGMTFIDAGANIGYYTIMAAGLVGNAGHVYAFEPDAVAFRYLRFNVERNTQGQVTPVHQALSNGPGTSCFNPSALEGGFISTLPRAGSTTIETESLDRFIEARDWPRVDVVKLDVEGAEASVLQGMTLVSRRNPQMTLILEFNQRAMRRAGTNPDDLAAIIRSLGFKSALIVEQRRSFGLESGLPASGLVYNLLITKGTTVPQVISSR